jgi:hypothetical protein
VVELIRVIRLSAMLKEHYAQISKMSSQTRVGGNDLYNIGSKMKNVQSNSKESYDSR